VVKNKKPGKIWSRSQLFAIIVEVMGRKNRSDTTATIAELQREISDFVEVRKWRKFHNPKDLSEAIAIESGELLEHFLWKSPRQAHRYLKGKKGRLAVAAELADLLILIFNFGQLFGIDLAGSLQKKLEILKKRYPVEKFKGRSDKYRPL